MPLPNRGNATNLSDNFSTLKTTSSEQRDYNFRIDQKLGQNNTVSVIFYRLQTTSQESFSTIPTDGGSNSRLGAKSIGIQDTHAFGTRVVNEFGFSRINLYNVGAVGNQSGRQILQSVGLTNLGGRQVPDSLGAPRINIPGFGHLAFFGQNLLGQSQGINETNDIRYIFRDNVSYQRGRHTLKGGFSLQRYVPNDLAAGGNSWGNYSFNGFATGNAFADFLLGIPQSTSITRPRGKLEEVHSEAGFYFQDDFKMTPRLTWNLGIRYQAFTVPIDKNGLFYNFDPTKLQVVVRDAAALSAVHPAYPKGIPVVTAQQAGYPDNLLDADWKGWEPRLGVAWRPWGDKFVVRSGWGLYHVPTTPGFALAGRAGGPFQLNESFGPTQIVNGVPSASFNNPFPTEPGRVGAQSLVALPSGYKIPYTMQWNLTLERELGSGFGGRVSYVGSKGSQWRYLQQLTQPLPSTLPFSPDRRPIQPASLYNSVSLAQNGGNMTYHAMELEMSRKFSSGFYFQSNFIWSKTLLDVLDGAQENGRTPTDSYNRSLDKGRADSAEPIIFSMSAVYDLPFGRGKRFANLPSGKAFGVLNQIIGNWKVSGLFLASAGQIFTPTYAGFDSTGTGISSGRPDAVCNDQSQRDETHWFNRDCYRIPSTTGTATGQSLGRFGNAARGSLRGPGYWSEETGLFKDFPLLPGRGESSPRLRFSANFQNTANHPHQGGFFGCNSNISSAGFGTCPKGATTFWANPGRTIYLTTQLVF